MKKTVAIPTINNCLCQHFDHCEKFILFETENEKVTAEQYPIPPPHEPGVLPAWLASQGATHIIAGDMRYRAVSLFNQQNIKVINGAQEKPAKILICDFLENKLTTGANSCYH